MYQIPSFFFENYCDISQFPINKILITIKTGRKQLQIASGETAECCQQSNLPLFVKFCMLKILVQEGR